MKKVITHIVILYVLGMLAGCSVIPNLPEDEFLYTGIDKVKVENEKGTLAEENALVEVKAALDYAPNGAILGSSYARSPFQLGLWTYNALVDKQRTGFSKWFFNAFASTPITISQVSPDIRVKVATNLLQNYGYFRGKVDYHLVDQRRDQQKKIAYDITLGEPYLFDSIRYVFPPEQDSLIHATQEEPYIKMGGQFSTFDLTSEKTRIVNALRNNGYYYYRPDYVTYLADSMLIPQRVKLLVAPDINIPERANRKYHFGTISAYIRQNMRSTEGRQRRLAGTQNTYDDSLTRRSIKVAYQGKSLPVAPRVLFKNFKFWHRQLFDQSKVDQTLNNLHSMDIFSSVKLNFIPRDSVSATDSYHSVKEFLSTFDNPLKTDTLDVRLDLTLDQLVEAEVDFNITQKSNSQIGPHLGLTLSKRNAFHHGETLSVGLKGSYEWQTRTQFDSPKRIDSYELGADASLSYPWIAFPWLNKRFYKYPTSTKFRLSIDQLNRANYYRLISFIGESTYSFQTSRSWSHQLSPFTISYNKMQETTERFDSIMFRNPSLYASLLDQFIPAIQYSIIYDNVWNKRIPHIMHFEATVKESGNLLNTTNALLGFDFYQKDKKLLFTQYSQFLKLLFTLKNTFHLTEKTSIATRVQLGALWSYGNSDYAPYSEMFYIGGANSIRAFAVRSIGPGRYRDTVNGTYLDQTGDLKLELNAEYRFPIIQQIQGALFVDAGNVWLMRDDEDLPGGRFGVDGFFNSLAVGTGVGIRYNLDFLILRLDLGVGIHAPYDTGTSSYYNLRKFKDAVAFHFAIGYPF
ncbi:MAG: BamA/TamA family outer membrane protein [Bacteroidaceae bacterium]|nr:BamA/TamA family outer membrane protein [Bacteroidaceae bacterium]